MPPLFSRQLWSHGAGLAAYIGSRGCAVRCTWSAITKKFRWTRLDCEEESSCSRSRIGPCAPSAFDQAWSTWSGSRRERGRSSKTDVRMPSSQTSPAQILLAAATAAAESSTFSAAGAGTVRTWRTRDRQPQIKDNGVRERRCEFAYYLLIKAAKRNGEPSSKHKEIK